MARDGSIRDKIVIIWQEIVSTWQEMAAPQWYGGPQ